MNQSLFEFQHMEDVNHFDLCAKLKSEMMNNLTHCTFICVAFEFSDRHEHKHRCSSGTLEEASHHVKKTIYVKEQNTPQLIHSSDSRSGWYEVLHINVSIS